MCKSFLSKQVIGKMRILPYTKDFNKERHKNKFHLICLTKEEDKNNIVTLKL